MHARAGPSTTCSDRWRCRPASCTASTPSAESLGLVTALSPGAWLDWSAEEARRGRAGIGGGRREDQSSSWPKRTTVTPARTWRSEGITSTQSG